MQLKELAAKVQSLGLNDKEARVYVAALFLGPSSAQKIAGQADINRATAYVILDQLADLGLVSQTQDDKKTLFVAEPPEALERLFDRQQEAIEGRKRELKQLIPELRQTERTTRSDAPMVRFYKGQEGVQVVSSYMRRKARPGSMIYSLSNFDEVEKYAPGILKHNPVARLKKNLHSRLFYTYKEPLASDPKILREAKEFDEPIKADIVLFEDKASFTTYTDNPADTTGVIIESPEIVGTLRQLFERAWKNVN